MHLLLPVLVLLALGLPLEVLEVGDLLLQLPLLLPPFLSTLLSDKCKVYQVLRAPWPGLYFTQVSSIGRYDPGLLVLSHHDLSSVVVSVMLM